MLSRKIDTVIVGGGQAGLAISYYLSQEGRAHVVLYAKRGASPTGVLKKHLRSRYASFKNALPAFRGDFNLSSTRHHAFLNVPHRRVLVKVTFGRFL
jgi:cation diffusion facilitator CzcD-associated flavoprotein CzcO